MGLTLVEQVKLAFGRDEALDDTMGEPHAKYSDLLQYLPFQPIPGFHLPWTPKIWVRKKPTKTGWYKWKKSEKQSTALWKEYFYGVSGVWKAVCYLNNTPTSLPKGGWWSRPATIDELD